MPVERIRNRFRTVSEPSNRPEISASSISTVPLNRPDSAISITWLSCSLASTVPIDPGLYATAFDREGCGYELRRYGPKGDERLIGQDHLPRGRMLVSLNAIEPDSFVPLIQCGGWSPWSALYEPLVVAGAGDYWIGDLAHGVWSVPEGCYWEEVADFRGARLADVVASGRGPSTLLIDDESLGLRVRECERPLVMTTPLLPTLHHLHQ